ncbi:TadE family protein [Arthrobacter sp. GCM10027362]|uniref:TadE family protein n=1 Tax=Arthrobacter sp. GCM10027362 TaxID=3273379 RepID=UPI0036383EEC
MPRCGSRDKALGGERGSAAVDFVLIGGVLVLMCMSIVQLALVLHVRNTLIDAAGSGARYGTLADRGPSDARDRTVSLITSSLGPSYAREVAAEAVDSGPGRMLRVTVTSPLPAFGLLGPAQAMTVQGHAPLPR